MTSSANAPAGNAAAGPSNFQRPTPPTFGPASSFLPSNGSLRNASSSGSANGGTSSVTSSDAALTESPAPATSNGDNTTPATTDEAAATTPAGPVKPVHRSKSSKNAIVYSAVQRRNPVLGAIKNVPTEIGDIQADYQVGTHNGVLYLSLKYHRLHPEYIHTRIENMKGMYQLRILLILCDVTEHQQSLRELSKIAIVNNFSTIVAWSNDEIAQYLTTFKQYEHKSADTLKERVHQSYRDQLQHVLTSGKKVNKTDAYNLGTQFGSFANMASQSAKMLSTVKGLGTTKVNTLFDAFNKPFLVGGLQRPSSAAGSSSNGTEMVPPIHKAGASNGRAEKASKGKRKGRADAMGDGDDAEQVGSPDWPSGSDEGEGSGSSAGGGAPSRSRDETSAAAVVPKASGAWRDPLEEDDAQDEAAEMRQEKRQRVE